MSREQRKLDHIRYALELGDGPLNNGLENVRFLHNCLPELAPADIDITTTLSGIKLSVPFLVNAITGGTDNVTEINRKLAQQQLLLVRRLRLVLSMALLKLKLIIAVLR